MLGKLFGLCLGAIFLGVLAPAAINAVLNVDTSEWGNVAPLWLIVPIALVIGFVILILKEVGIYEG
jgi:hypothetical protein